MFLLNGSGLGKGNQGTEKLFELLGEKKLPQDSDKGTEAQKLGNLCWVTQLESGKVEF